MLNRLTRRSTEAVCAALLPPEAGGPTPAKAAADLDRFLTQLPPAIANAIYDAVGVRITQLPIRPEHVLQLMKEKKKEQEAAPDVMLRK